VRTPTPLLRKLVREIYFWPSNSLEKGTRHFTARERCAGGPGTVQLHCPEALGCVTSHACANGCASA
jgi:hypothetical protein